ncbi:MAG: AAA family ATPase, partial [Bacteroidales bacterium]|nr:AAA family ATPase [Bacteroidales bacterium]
METKIPKRIPYGSTNFESIRTENYVYIDKTQYIELLEQENNKNLFLTRPRK